MSESIRPTIDLDEVATTGLATLYPDKLKVLIGSASCGLAAGAREVEEATIEVIEKLDLDAIVSRTGCIGFCDREPIVDLRLPGGPRVSYEKMTAGKVRALLEAYAAGKDLPSKSTLCRVQNEEHVEVGEIHSYPASTNGVNAVPEWTTLDFYRKQERVILRNCGSIDPHNIEEAIARGAYRGAKIALLSKTPHEVVAEVLESGLRGRGGAGFPTGKKWLTTRDIASDSKYVICNADEGDPGAFMDRSVLEGDPHAVLEGLIIGAYATGASEGYVYVRSEYPLAVSTIQHAIEEAEASGLLGENIFGTGFSFRVRVRKGAGAFVCGEETSLIASIEGHSGEPRTRPPYPAVSGLWGKPTVINNVKTWASVGPILSRGAAWYSSLGSDGNRGTTVFSLVGAVKNTGLVEVPLGISLREMVFDVGGGMAGNHDIKAVQTGGPSGGCIPASMLDIAVDYEKLAEAGSMMGSGGMIVLDQTTCMVDLARFFLVFTAEESCGKCTPCREGTKQMLEILTRICEGRGSPEDLPLLERLASTVKSTSLCGLGGSAPNPVLTAMQHFRSEFEEHVFDGKCTAGVCPALITLSIEESACTGCTLCVAVCPVGAIQGERKQTHEINSDICTRCGACRQVCPTDAVVAL